MSKADIIKNILSKGNYFADRKLNFGVHKGQTLDNIYKFDRTYLLWILSEEPEGSITAMLQEQIRKGFINAEGKDYLS